jgi:hypothetical protein
MNIKSRAAQRTHSTRNGKKEAQIMASFLAEVVHLGIMGTD